MNHLDRFHATLERRPVDRPCTWLGMPVVAARAGLFAYFGVSSARELTEVLEDDLWPVELPYHSPTSEAIYAAFDWAQQGQADLEHRTLTTPGWFAGCTEVEAVETFDWPDPALYIDPEECRRVVAESPQACAILGVIWSAHFQDACAAFGMEDALVRLYVAPDVFRAVIDRITDFYLRANEIFYQACGRDLHAVLIGNDFGSQTGLMVSPELLREFVLPGTHELVCQAKRYGLRVIHHSCGSIRPLIPDLIAAGVDAIHPIQALAAGMDAEGLRRDFGDQVAFCGGVDAQQLLVNGTPEEVAARVRELRRVFPTGLILSPSHEAILPDIPPANVEALFTAAHET